MPSSRSARTPPDPDGSSPPFERQSSRDGAVNLSVPIPEHILDGFAEAIAARTVDALREQLDTASPWLTTEEAAEYLRVPLGTFRERAARGEFDAIAKQEGRRVYYHRSDLDVHRRDYVRKAGSDLAGPG